MRWTPHTGAEPREGAVLKASGPQAQPACAGVRWAGIGAVAVRRDELDGTGAELTIPMTVPTSCRAYRADARSAGRDICGNQDLHVPVLQRARDMQVFLYILLCQASWRQQCTGKHNGTHARCPGICADIEHQIQAKFRVLTYWINCVLTPASRSTFS